MNFKEYFSQDYVKSLINNESEWIFKRFMIIMILDSISTITALKVKHLCPEINFSESNLLTRCFHETYGPIEGQVRNALFVDVPLYFLISIIMGWYYVSRYGGKRRARILSIAFLVAFALKSFVGNFIGIILCLRI